MGELEQRAREVFLAALMLEGRAREVYLTAECTNPELKARVHSLLAHHHRAEDFLAGSTKPLESDQPEPLPFERLADFEIIREIGRGGIGVVYLAREPTLGRRVALKVLLPQFALSRKSLTRFQHEAQIAAKLTHPAIVPIHRFGNEGSIHYIASEYIDGPTLSEALRQRNHGSGRQYWADARGAVAMLIPIAEALAYAHGRGIIHRDIKPSNILLDAQGRAHLADFGLAKDLRADELTMTGDLAGTYLYMSPEQALAKRVKIDHRTDIFSFGVVLYEIASGKRPFDGNSNQEILQAITFTDPLPLTKRDKHIPRDLDSICQKALEKRPDDRYATAEELVDDLRRFFAGKPVAAKAVGNVRRSLRTARRRRHLLVGAVMTALALGAGTLLGRWPGPAERLPVQFESEPPGALVSLRPIDWATGEYQAPISVGTTPLSTDVAPGFYRVVFELRGYGFAELTRNLERTELTDASDRLQVDALLRETVAIVQPMIRIPPSEFVGGIAPTAPQYAQAEYTTPGFYIDAAEVTNREYHNFVLATGHAAPAWWNDRYDTSWDELPVVGVSWFDAQSFAEWAGKRLPTRLEWDRAARGVDGRKHPWLAPGEPFAGFSGLSCVGEPAARRKAERDDYLALACPVRQFAADISPDGVFDVFGSVMEWVDSVTILGAPGESIPDLSRRSARGFSWWLAIPQIGLEAVTEISTASSSPELYLGFRCAKSLKSDEVSIQPVATPLARSTDHALGSRSG